jgi:hypothetical protein
MPFLRKFIPYNLWVIVNGCKQKFIHRFIWNLTPTHSFKVNEGTILTCPMPVSHQGGPDSCPGQPMRDFWTKWQWDRFVSKLFSFPPSISLQHGSPSSCITWSMNNRPVGGQSSETSSHPTDNNCLSNIL